MATEKETENSKDRNVHTKEVKFNEQEDDLENVCFRNGEKSMEANGLASYGQGPLCQVSMTVIASLPQCT